VKSLLGKILTADPARRITLAQVKQDPWFTEGGYVSSGGDERGAEDSGAEVADDIGMAVEEEDKPVAPVAAKTIGGNHSAPGLKRLNAFDLINQCGGIALNRMLLTQSERQVVKVRQFTSSLPPLEVLQGIDAALQGMGCDTRLQADQFKVKGALLSSSGMIGVIIQSYSISGELGHGLQPIL
jgi:hypothetical protein